ncbi:hypothetical protein NE688_21215, partial [Eubacterium callanderi]|uniref:hypothetical protein n=1 Tax=Eubacterium callanderi TaxID=53442 RepID=UPI002108ACE6
GAGFGQLAVLHKNCRRYVSAILKILLIKLGRLTRANDIKELPHNPWQPIRCIGTVDIKKDDA